MSERGTPFGDLLRRLRSAASLSQEELAERAGLSRRGISDLERGARRAPHPETVRLLANALGLADADRAALLAAWIEELVFLAETEEFVPERLAEIELAPGMLRAGVEGRRAEPRHLVKSVTYHRLEFRRGDAGWVARVVLDV